MIWLLTTLAALAPFAVWGFRVYLARTQASAIERERQAGAAISQNEATNAEINRVNRAADAANSVPVGQVDPFDEAGK
jgi:hypothetical protein